MEANNTTRVILRLDPELLQAKLTFFSKWTGWDNFALYMIKGENNLLYGFKVLLI